MAAPQIQHQIPKIEGFPQQLITLLQVILILARHLLFYLARHLLFYLAFYLTSYLAFYLASAFQMACHLTLNLT